MGWITCRWRWRSKFDFHVKRCLLHARNLPQHRSCQSWSTGSVASRADVDLWARVQVFVWGNLPAASHSGNEADAAILRISRMPLTERLWEAPLTEKVQETAANTAISSTWKISSLLTRLRVFSHYNTTGFCFWAWLALPKRKKSGESSLESGSLC